jgi:site-specific recombinase XerD
MHERDNVVIVANDDGLPPGTVHGLAFHCSQNPDLPEAMQRRIHQNRWLKLAREGGQMTAQHLRDLETTRRYATLVAILLETKATLIDQTLDLHDRMIGALFNRAKHRHAEEFQQSGRAIHDKVRLYWRIGEASARQLELENVKAYHVGSWLDQHSGSRSTQRQHLAAIRLLFDSLMMRGVVEYNPAARAKPPRLVRESSHTPVFEEAEIVAFLDSITANSLKDIRDKALFCVLLYSWCRVSALTNLSVGLLRTWRHALVAVPKRNEGKEHELPVHSKAKEAVDLWLERSYLASNPSAPLFPSFGKNRETIELRRLDRRSVLKLVEKRAKESGILKRVCCHSFRARYRIHEFGWHDRDRATDCRTYESVDQGKRAEERDF